MMIFVYNRKRYKIKYHMEFGQKVFVKHQDCWTEDIYRSLDGFRMHNVEEMTEEDFIQKYFTEILGAVDDDWFWV